MSIRRRGLLIPIVAVAGLLTAALSFGKPPAKPQHTAAPASAPARAMASASSSAHPPPPIPAYQKAARGVVRLERAGRPIGLGVVLGGDGRVLTSLSVVGDGNNVDARYADGSVVKVRVGHSDRAWDLALLVPQAGRWDEGLGATSKNPLQGGTRTHTFTWRSRQARAAAAVLKGRGELVGGDGEVLRDALLLSTPVPMSDMGAPLVDDDGMVVGIVGRACSQSAGNATKACRPTPFGVPVDAIKQFLRSVPASAVPPSPWLGIQGVVAETPIVRGVRLVRIHPDSPANAAGLQAGDDAARADVVVAVDGVPAPSPERLAALVRGHAVGEAVELIVLRRGRFEVVKVTLKAAPAPSGQAHESP